MRILSIVHQFPPEFHSGTEILCLSTVQFLARRGHDVHVITADRKTPRGKKARRQRLYEIDVTYIPTGEPPHFGLVADLRDEFEREELIGVLTDHTRQFSPDIIHAHHFLGFGLLALPAVADIAPLVISATDFSLVCPYTIALLPDGRLCAGPDTDGTNCVNHHLARPSFDGTAPSSGWKTVLKRSADQIIALAGLPTVEGTRRMVGERLAAARRAGGVAARILVSSEKIGSMLAAAGLPAERIMMLPHQAPPLAVGDEPVRIPLRIGFLGVMSWHKGAHVLVEAVCLLPPDLPFELVIRGDLDAYPAYVRKLKSRAAADERIRIVDRVPFDRFGEAMSEIDVLVVPSLWAENAPLVLLSALQAGRYVVIADMPGLTASLPDGDCGCVVPAGNASALARVIEQLVRDPSPVMRARARRGHGKSFTRYVDAIEAVYREATTTPAIGESS